MSDSPESPPEVPVHLPTLKLTVDSHARRIGRLESNVADVVADVERIDVQLRAAVAASHRAANAAIEAQAQISNLRTEVSDSLARHHAELVRLLGNDALHDQQLARVDAFLQRATESAVASIQSQADAAGSRISTKVSIPVGLISALAVILQFIIQHWIR